MSSVRSAAYRNCGLDSGFEGRRIIREFVLSRSQRVTVGRQLSEEVRVTSGVPQGSVLDPLIFLVYLNDIWSNLELTIKLFTDDCVIYRKIVSDSDIRHVADRYGQTGEWAVENGVNISAGKSKAVSFTRDRLTDPLFILGGPQSSGSE